VAYVVDALTTPWRSTTEWHGVAGPESAKPQIPI